MEKNFKNFVLAFCLFVGLNSCQNNDELVEKIDKISQELNSEKPKTSEETSEKIKELEELLQIAKAEIAKIKSDTTIIIEKIIEKENNEVDLSEIEAKLGKIENLLPVLQTRFDSLKNSPTPAPTLPKITISDIDDLRAELDLLKEKPNLSISDISGLQATLENLETDYSSSEFKKVQNSLDSLQQIAILNSTEFEKINAEFAKIKEDLETINFIITQDLDFYSALKVEIEMIDVNSQFLMSKTEITQRQYGNVIEWAKRIGFVKNLYPEIVDMKSLPSFYKDEPANGEIQENRPVENMSYRDVLLFCNLLTIQKFGSEAECVYDFFNGITCNYEKKGYRLPRQSDYEFINNSNPFTGSDYDWQVGITHEVGKKTKNIYGLYDLMGNVNEFVECGFSKTPIMGSYLINYHYTLYPFKYKEDIFQWMYPDKKQELEIYHASPISHTLLHFETASQTTGFRVVQKIQ